MLHYVMPLSTAVVGLLAGFAIVVTTDMFVLTDIAKTGPVTEPGREEDGSDQFCLPTWFATIVLLAAELISLAAFAHTHTLLSYLSLSLVLFTLLAAVVLDSLWQLIPLDLFIPLALGSIGWVLLHPVTVWLGIVSGIVALFGIVPWLIHGRRSYGDLALAPLVGLFCGAGVENLWQFLATTDRLAIGMGVGALVALSAILARRLSERDHENKTPLRLLGGAGSPVFLFAALFSLILH